MRKSLRLGVAFVAGLACGAARAGGAYVQPEGNGQSVTSMFVSGAAVQFDSRGRVVPLSPWVKVEGTTLLEYGLTDWGTLLLSSAVDRYADENTPVRGVSAMGLSTIGGRVALLQRDHWTLSTEASLRIPGLMQRVWMRSSDGVLSGEARLAGAYTFSIGRMNGFIDTSAGYRWHARDYAGDVVVDSAIGLQPVPHLMFLVQQFFDYAPASQLQVGHAVMKVQASVVYKVSPAYALQIGAFTTAVARNAARERGLMTSVWRAF